MAIRPNPAAPTIRSATLDDAALLSEIGGTSFFDAFGADPRNRPEDVQAYVLAAFSVEAIRQELAHPDVICLVAEAGAAAIGYVKLQLGTRFSCVTGQNPIEVSRLYTRKEWIGRGVGPALMQACLDEGRKRRHDVIWLGVWEFNFRAQRFYEKWGFHRVGEHAFVLGSDPQIDWVLQRAL